jgi:Tol biopolymer transport system component
VWRWWHTAIVAGAAALVVLGTVSTWNVTRGVTAPPADPFANAQFTRLTDWPGTEAGAAISPDGKFVAFVSDKAGEFDIWLSQIGGGEPINLTADFAPLESVGAVFKKFGFSSDGAQIWFSPGTGAQLAQMIMPLIGGTRRAFLERNATAPAWSPDGDRIVYFINRAGDPMFLADRSGGNPRPIEVDRQAEGKGLFETGMHNHNPMWSWDGAWIYFAHGPEPTGAMDIWRMRPTGASLERLTEHGIGVNLLAPLDARTVLYIGRAEDGSGPWLWALDVERKTSRRVSLGLGQYTSVSATRDGRRVVATIANPSATLWRAPLQDRPVEDRDVQPYPLKTERALAPRFSGKTLFYLSRSGSIDGLWRAGENEAPHQIWSGGVLSEPPVVSPDGSRVVVIARQEGKRRLVIMSSDGRSAATLAPSLEVQGFFAGQGMADWSPDGAWIVAGGTDATQHQGLFKVPVSGGAPIRLVAGEALNPIWSPDGKFIVYGSTFATGQVDLLAVSPDGARIDMALVRARPGGYRFLPDGSRLVYLQYIPSVDFSLFDFATKQSRQLTRLSNRGDLGTFDITPDGKEIVFDRSRENADIVLIDLPR